MRSVNSRGILLDVAKGAIAGAAATWLMNQVTTWMYACEGESAKERENAARGGRTAYETAAEKGAALAGMELSDERRSQAGTLIHWATGIAGGVTYALLRRQSRTVAGGKGTAFGTGFFLLVDELLNPALGLTPGPQAFPWQTHARGLGGHVAFGLTNELILEGLDRVA